MRNEIFQLKILNNNLLSNFKTIPFKTKLINSRNKYAAPVAKEWKYTIYNYYKDTVKNIPTNTININNIIKSYFNLYFLPKFLYIKFMSKKRRNKLLRRIYISNIELKQNNNKVLITLYIINTERKRMIRRYFKKELLKKIKILSNKYINFFNKELKIFNSIKLNTKIWNDYVIFLKSISKGSIKYNWGDKYAILKLKKIFLIYLNKLNINKKKISFINYLYHINNYEFNRFLWFYFFESKKIYLLELLYELKFKYLMANTYQEIKIISKLKEVKKIFNQWKILMLFIEEFLKRNFILDKINNQFLNLNIFNISFNKNKKYIYPYKLFIKKLDKTFSYLYILNKYMEKVLKKKIEFNIINLKSIVLNSDIFTKSLSLKLRKKKRFKVFSGIRDLTNKVKLPNISSFIERKKLKKENLTSTFIKNNLASNMKILTYFYVNIQKSNIIPIINFEKIIFKSLSNIIKYKNIGGLRLEVRGRLTRRYRADKALYKFNLIGGLRNIESSYNLLKSSIYRGYYKPNVTYSFIKSKRRIGAFAIKGWVSGK